MNVRKKTSSGKHGRPEAAYEVMTSENIGRLAGGIAHDLNTILTTIYGYCELALESAEPSSEIALNIRNITGAADKARALTEQLLNLRRGKDQEKSVVNLNDIVSETIGFIKPSLSEKVKIVRRFPSADILVTADPVQLFRVFLNLAVNAVQAMEKDGGKLTVSLSTVSDVVIASTTHSMCALVRFSDTGTGMDQATSSRIFKPFYTTGKDGRGTGLGLTVVSDIIHTIKGDIRVISEPGRGTVIDVLIPLTQISENHSRRKKTVNK